MNHVSPPLRPSLHFYYFVLSLIFLLACFFIIKKISLAHYIANDFFSMQGSLLWECNFKSNSAFSFLPRCVTLFSSYIYKTPILYLSAIVLLLSLKFYFLFKALETLARKTAEPVLAIYIASFAIMLVLIGGAGRFSLGSGNILSLADIYTRTWAQVFLLAALYTFVKNRLLLTSFLLGPALLLQAVNATNFTVVLAVAYVLSAPPKSLLRLPMIGAPFLIFFAYQYYITYGIPSFSLYAPNAEGVENSVSITQWYKYIYSQDADDLSIIFQFRQGWVSLGYIFIGIVGLVFGNIVEKAGSLRATMARPGMAIMIAGYLYIALCAAVEFFQSPVFILKHLIILQPRRIMYLPHLIATLYFAYFTIEFMCIRESATRRRWIALVLVYMAFGSLLVLSTWDNSGVSKIPAAVYTIFLIGLFTVVFLVSRFRPEDISRIPRSLVIFPLILLVTSAQALPHLSAKTFSDFKAMFFTTQSRDYSGYLLLTAQLSNQAEWMRDFFDMVPAIAALPPESGTIITVGIGQKTQVDFSIFSRKGIRGIDPFTAARGGTHYDKSRLVGIAPILTETSGLSLDEFVKLDRGEQILIFEDFAKKNVVDSPELVRSMASTGIRPKYFLFSESCPNASPKDRIVYANDHYCLYRSSFWPMQEGTSTLFEQ